MHCLDALTGGTARRGRDEADLLGLAGLADVDDVHAGVVAADAAPGGEVGEALENAYVGDLPLYDVAQLEFADQADVFLSGRQVSSAAAVLVVAVGGCGVVDGAVGCRDAVMCLCGTGESGRGEESRREHAHAGPSVGSAHACLHSCGRSSPAHNEVMPVTNWPTLRRYLVVSLIEKPITRPYFAGTWQDGVMSAE